ncbi:cytochrome P450 3A18-like [Tachypleus tridentatus]|uniref:cytochrome P450 3A18-like n=1 Tax=Tachypleus tridentatus TaxID=6853 RepID=UPI003FD24BB8
MVAEPELIKLITVKDFHVFSDRRVFEMGDPILDKMLTIQTGEEWRQTRSLISPTFGSGKMKKMAFLVKNTIHSLIQNQNFLLENVAVVLWPTQSTRDLTMYFQKSAIGPRIFGVSL